MENARTAYIALGGNQGDRRDYFDRAIQALQEHPHIDVTQVSSYYETAPVGGPPGQPTFLNAAAELKTDLSARELLNVLSGVERDLGRIRRERHGPRTIDLDLLLYGDQVIQEAGLAVPHPAMHERWFVLKPLAEIAPQAIHPLLDARIQDLLENLARKLPEALPVQETSTETRIMELKQPALDPSGWAPRHSRPEVKGMHGRELAGLDRTHQGVRGGRDRGQGRGRRKARGAARFACRGRG